VLDIGCGNGQTTRLAARRASKGRAVGFDLSAPMLERAAANLSREAERRALALSTLLEPLLILLMGAVVLGIVLAVLMPIIEINTLVR
jgi:SAM-dependent methyltransferase